MASRGGPPWWHQAPAPLSGTTYAGVTAYTRREHVLDGARSLLWESHRGVSTSCAWQQVAKSMSGKAPPAAGGMPGMTPNLVALTTP